MKLKRKVKVWIAIVLCALLGTVSIFLAIRLMSKDTPTAPVVKVINRIEEYGYELKDNETKEYKKIFEQLKDTLNKEEVDEEAYVSLIAKMFVIDFYSLKEKLAKTDIGGVDFVHKDAYDDFVENAMDTLYKYVESNLYGDRKQELPKVKNIEVNSVEKTSFTYHDKKDNNAYQVKLSWTYDQELGYQKEATLTFVHVDKVLALVELN